MASIAVIAPDGNRVVGFTHNTLPLRALLRKQNLRRLPGVIVDDPVSTVGDWPFRFDRVYVCTGRRWRSFRPDDLPMKYR